MPSLLSYLKHKKKHPHASQSTQESRPPLEDGEADEVRAIAEAIRRRGLGEPVVLMLRVLRPLSWMGGQALWMLQPFFGGPKGRSQDAFSVQKLAGFLEREGNVERLIGQLEHGDRARR